MHAFVRSSTIIVLAAGSLVAQDHAHGTEQLGTVHFRTSCSAAVAPKFDRAVALLHSFAFSASIRAFTDVASTDSTCAMAYWGVALSRWGNPMAAGIKPPAQLRLGREAANTATRLGAAATERERLYIAAIAELFRDFERIDQRTRVVAYERAMNTLVTRQPADTEAKIFYALSVAASALPTDKTYANYRQAGTILEPIFAKQPNHPGLAHYIIHTYDVPTLAPRASTAARRYAEIAPSLAHAQHMPSHTFTRVGLWQQSVDANRRSADFAMKEGSIAEALHALDYAAYANLQMRKLAAAKALVDQLPALAAKFDPNAVTGAAPGSAGVFALAAIPARYALERRAWAEAAAIVPAPSAVPWTEAMTYFARALGASHTNNLALARSSIDSLAAIRDRLTAAGESYWAEQVAIQHLGANAWLLLAERRQDSALALMRQAAQREDATEKNVVTPGSLVPARELLGDMLFDLRRPKEALAEYRATLDREPNRYRATEGAMRAAGAAGDTKGQALYADRLKRITG